MIADMQTLTDAQCDALREVANIGAGHAATALSMMTGSKIMISVPRIAISPLKDVMPTMARPDDPVAVVPMSMHGSLDGHTILVFPLLTAHRLTAKMLRRNSSDLYMPSSGLSELEESALTEAGNILAGAYMTALSEFMRMSLLPSPPSLNVGPARHVLTNAAAGVSDSGAYVFCVETQFMLDDVGDRFPGYFLLLPNPASLGAMLEAISAS
jgi:chemotaxis protein CheC